MVVHHGQLDVLGLTVHCVLCPTHLRVEKEVGSAHGDVWGKEWGLGVSVSTSWL